MRGECREGWPRRSIRRVVWQWDERLVLIIDSLSWKDLPQSEMVRRLTLSPARVNQMLRNVRQTWSILRSSMTTQNCWWPAAELTALESDKTVQFHLHFFLFR